MTQLIYPDKRVLVIGSLNANPADRIIDRKDIKTLQLIDDKSQVMPIDYFE